MPAPTIYKWNGTIIRTATGEIARSAECCCNNTPPGGGCCPDFAYPATITLDITNKTGDCSCLPDTVTLDLFQPPGDITNEPGVWAQYLLSVSSEDCGVTLFFQLSCVDVNYFTDPYPGPDYQWIAVDASTTITAELVSAVCDPFELVFAADNSAGGSTACDGTYTMTFHT